MRKRSELKTIIEEAKKREYDIKVNTEIPNKLKNLDVREESLNISIDQLLEQIKDGKLPITQQIEINSRIIVNAEEILVIMAERKELRAQMPHIPE